MDTPEFTSPPEDTELEQWRPIPGMNGNFVSTLGNVYSVRTRRLRRFSVLPKRGYRTLNYSGGVCRLVHRIVLETFVGPKPDGMEACHLNGVAWDNRLVNLKWVTHSENELHKRQHGTAVVGERHPRAKLTWADVCEMRRLRTEEGRTYPELALRFGLKQGTVYCICVGRTWKHATTERGAVVAPAKKVRPTIDNLSQEGPALTPEDFGRIVGLRRAVVAEMCRLGEIPAFSVGTIPRKRRWKISRQWALSFCQRIGMKPAA